MRHLSINIPAVVFIVLLASCNSRAQENGFSNIQPGGLATFLKENNAVILDVRTPREWDGGKVEAALTINLGHPGFNETIAELDRDATYLVYCNSGNRSRIASQRMVDMGFKNIFNYNGYHYQIRQEYEELEKERPR
jgi:phage shock protein E